MRNEFWFLSMLLAFVLAAGFANAEENGVKGWEGAPSLAAAPRAAISKPGSLASKPNAISAIGAP